MSEHAPKPETGHEALPAAVHESLPEHPRSFSKENERGGLTPQEARAAVEKIIGLEDHTGPRERLQAAEKAPHQPSMRHVNRELKQITLRRELQTIRRRLPPADRVFSRLIHQPAVRVASEAVGKTAARPSGLLGGGLMALVGSGGYLYLARHWGFEYNYGVFLLLFVVGFMLGLLLELLVQLFTHHRRADH